MTKYYKVGRNVIYVFDMTKRTVYKYGFKPPNKRIRLKNTPSFFLGRRFFLLYNFHSEIDPKNWHGTSEWKELKIGDYL